MMLACLLAFVQISEMWVDQFRVDVIHIPRSLWELTLSRQQLLIRRGELAKYDGLLLSRYNHVLNFGGVKFQVNSSHFAYISFCLLGA